MKGFLNVVMWKSAAALAVTAIALLLPGQALAQSGEVIEYIHTDALGSPVAVTNAAGQVIETTVYEPYGGVVNRPLSDGPGYTGHVTDASTGLSYMQQRYYDPEVGAFLSVDPVTPDAEGVWHFNRYRYANGNPYVHIDPDGRQGKVAWLVRLTETGMKNVARLTQQQAVRARRAGQNVRGDRESVSGQIERAAHPNGEQLKHKGHTLADGTTGLPHYQTEGVTGHSFWGRASILATSTAESLEKIAEGAEYIPDPTPRPGEREDVDRWNNLMGVVSESTGIPMPGVKMGGDGKFEGYYRVEGRIDAKRISKEKMSK